MKSHEKIKKIVDEYEKRFEWNKTLKCYFIKNTNIKASLEDLFFNNLLTNLSPNKEE